MSKVQLGLVRVAELRDGVVIPIPIWEAVGGREVVTSSGSSQETTLAVPNKPYLFALRVAVAPTGGAESVAVSIGATATETAGWFVTAGATEYFNLRDQTPGDTFQVIEVAAEA